MSLAEFLEKQQKPTLFDWADMSNADFGKVRSGLTDAIKHFEPNYRELHKDVIDNLTRYLMRSDDFTGDLNKGLMLMGQTGTGKTLMLSAFALMMKYVHRKNLKIKTGFEIEQLMRSTSQQPVEFGYSCFGIDDLGEEHDSVKVYGTEISVGIELLTIRHKEFMQKGSLTFCTTNCNREDLKAKYGPRIDSRIDEMFNVIPVTGKDNRKK